MTSVPAVSSSRTTASSPRMEASWSAVASFHLMFTLAPFSSSIWTIDAFTAGAAVRGKVQHRLLFSTCIRIGAILKQDTNDFLVLIDCCDPERGAAMPTVFVDGPRAGRARQKRNGIFVRRVACAELCNNRRETNARCVVERRRFPEVEKQSPSNPNASAEIASEHDPSGKRPILGVEQSYGRPVF